MKQLAGILILMILSLAGAAQDFDSMLAVPQTLELNISTPQPRLQEKFQITVDINYVRAHIFRSALDKIELAEDIGNTDEGLMILNVNATEKGKTEIGPLEFTLNGTKYTTNKIGYEVVDALPNVDKGVWFRKVFTSDSTFCIIIEQRIPANSRVTNISETETKYWTEPVTDNIAKFKMTYSVDGLRGSNSTSYTNFGSITDKNGVEKQFMSGYSITYFNIIDRKKKIIITRDKFENLPDDYKFVDIIVQ